jgi:hypothetical protein
LSRASKLALFLTLVAQLVAQPFVVAQYLPMFDLIGKLAS